MLLQIVQAMGYQDRWRLPRQTCATGIVSAYSLTYLLASLCLATGAFHPAPPASHHHESHSHDHHHDAPSDARGLDICDFALQILLTPASLPAPERIAVWELGEAMRGLDHDAIPAQVPADLSIRSPPLAAMV
jgi:hypothetical protein